MQNIKQHAFFQDLNFAAVSARKQPVPWDDTVQQQLQAKRIDEAFDQRRGAAKVLAHLMQKESLQSVSNFDYVSPRAIMEEYLENVYQLRMGDDNSALVGADDE